MQTNMRPSFLGLKFLWLRRDLQREKRRRQQDTVIRNRSQTLHQLANWQTRQRYKTFMRWQALGKCFYELSTREESHVLTLSIHLVEFGAGAHSTQAHGARLAGGSVYIILCDNISSCVSSPCWTHALPIVLFSVSSQRAALQRALWTRRRKSLHSALSTCLILVVLAASAGLCV